MTTVTLKLHVKIEINELARRVYERQNEIFDDDDVKISSVYFKNGHDIISYGEHDSNSKCFPKTLNFKCVQKTGNHFKIRLFYSKELKTLHCASGLLVSDAEKYVRCLSKFMNNECTSDVNVVLVNGISQVKFGLSLQNLIVFFEKSNMKFSYTPKRNASLKLFTARGTICIHSTGSILFMGSKSVEDVMELHNHLEEILMNI